MFHFDLDTQHWFINANSNSQEFLSYHFSFFFLDFAKWYKIFQKLSFLNGLSWLSQRVPKWKTFQSRFQSSYSVSCYTKAKQVYGFKQVNKYFFPSRKWFWNAPKCSNFTEWFSKYLTALKYWLLSSERWSSISLFNQKSEPIHIKHHYHL